MSIDTIFRKFFWVSDAIEFKPHERHMTVFGKEVGVLWLGVTPKNRLVMEKFKSYNGAFETIKIVIRDYNNLARPQLREWGKLCHINESEFDRYIKQVYIETLQKKRREDLMKGPKYHW